LYFRSFEYEYDDEDEDEIRHNNYEQVLALLAGVAMRADKAAGVLCMWAWARTEPEPRALLRRRAPYIFAA